MPGVQWERYLQTKDTDRDFFMSAAESVEYGLIDAVISKPTLAALAGAPALPSA
jgi:ATP-dependent protease ClpP protease subunit